MQPPWSAAIAVGAKLVENRSRPMRYRGPLAIHTGARWSTRGGADDAVIAALAGPGALGPISEQAGREILHITMGAIVAVVDVVDCHPEAGCCRPWGEPHLWHIVLDNVRQLAEPIPARGRLGLWNIELEETGCPGASRVFREYKC